MPSDFTVLVNPLMQFLVEGHPVNLLHQSLVQLLAQVLEAVVGHHLACLQEVLAPPLKPRSLKLQVPHFTGTLKYAECFRDDLFSYAVARDDRDRVFYSCLPSLMRNRL
jgi:hypothetical protein